MNIQKKFHWIALDFDGVITKAGFTKMPRDLHIQYIRNRAYSKANKVNMQVAAAELGQDIDDICDKYFKQMNDSVAKQ